MRLNQSASALSMTRSLCTNERSIYREHGKVAPQSGATTAELMGGNVVRADPGYA